jgi:hypothetical protein
MMMNNRPEIGDMIMLLRPEIRELPPKVRRGRPPKVPRIETETTWHDDVEAIVISGPTQGISSDGEDYWLEWLTQRLDDGTKRAISSGGRGYISNSFRIVRRANE